MASFGARRGWPRAQVMLGAILEREPPVNVNLSRANELYRAAAERGNAQAMWNLGVNHLGTKGGRRDPDQALHWLREAARRDHALASWALARLYLAGTLVDRDPREGVSLLERSARAGSRSAVETLISLYRDGTPGVEPDPKRAAYWELRLLPWHQRFFHRLGFGRQR
jgi:TPR repeat protein